MRPATSRRTRAARTSTFRSTRWASTSPNCAAEFGLDTQPDAEDIAGTRSNMLHKVLDADRYPYALISVNDPQRATA